MLFPLRKVALALLLSIASAMIGLTPALAQVLPDLSALDTETRDCIELACIKARVKGPAAFGRCLREQLNALRNSPGIPDLSSLDAEIRDLIELACVVTKINGPVAYGRCLNEQLESIGFQPRAPAQPPSLPSALPPQHAIAQPPASSEEEFTIDTLERILGLHQPKPSKREYAWSGVKKPAKPQKLCTATLTPDAVFKSAERSVYVLKSAPSEDDLRTQSHVKQGSAVAVSERVALTNFHVLEGNDFHLLIKGEHAYRATIAYAHQESDRCAVIIQSSSLTPVSGVRAFSSLAVGERVYSIGSPNALENTLSEGLVSGLRQRSGIDLVQTSAPISPGSSGGGLFDAAGNLIGVTTFLMRNSQNLNFAIAADAFWK